MTAFDYQRLWQSQTIKPGQTLELDLGSLSLWIHRGEQNWRVAYEIGDENEERCSISVSDEPRDPRHDWTRWVLDNDVNQIQLKPQLPDRALIVRPEMPMCLMPKQSAQFFISIPIWVAITYGRSQEQVMEIPSATLSNSWFGPFTEGELCYTVKTTAKSQEQDLRFSANRVVFPLEIKNASKEKLNFERLCVRPQFLNVYQGKTRMWTSKGRVSYRGEDTWSRIVYSSLPPEFDQANRMLGKAREPIQRGALLKTFDNLKQRVEIS